MSHCKVCENSNGNLYHQVKEMMFGTGHSFTYMECSNCGTISLQDPPADLQDYYPAAYYSYAGLVPSPFWKNVLKSLRLYLYLHFGFSPPIYGEWIKQGRVRKNHRIADFGCGSGQLLYELYAAGFIHLEGYDPYIEKDVKVNQALSIYKKSIFEIEEGDKFDVVMMHHAFEHMEEPKKIILKAFDLLVPGGLLLIRIPVADAAVWKEYGVNWVQLDAPRHFFLHTVKSMNLMADAAGFEMEKIIFDSTAFQFWGSELYKSGVSLFEGKDLKRFTKGQLQGWEEKAIRLNQDQLGDQACFYLRKG